MMRRRRAPALSLPPEARQPGAFACQQQHDLHSAARARPLKRIVNGTETWQVYGLGRELLAEYKSGAATFLPTKEYGYRGRELLMTMSSGDDARVARFVTNVYYGALQRHPASTKLTNGVNSLATAGAQGQSQLLTAATSLARGLFTETNYESTRSDTQFVTDVYYACLQRGPDTGCCCDWRAQNHLTLGLGLIRPIQQRLKFRFSKL
jgi:hypothetical protein